MHEWHSRTNTNIMSLIDEFIGFEFQTDYSNSCNEVEKVSLTNKVFETESEAREYVTSCSYGSNTAYVAAYTLNKKLTKAYTEAYKMFARRRKEYVEFKSKLNIGYGRTTSKVTCPNCGSSINLNYGKRFKSCPVCGSDKIISDSNWKILETKKNMTYKTSKRLSEEACKNNVSFVCGIEWHC